MQIVAVTDFKIASFLKKEKEIEKRN